jgi:hypothetical protein
MGCCDCGWIALVLILGLVGFIRSRSSRTNHQPDASTSTQSVMSKGNQPTTTARKPPVTALVRRRVQALFAGRWWRWSIITVFLLTIAVVALTLVVDARLGAARVLHGEAWRSTVGGMPMTSMQALPAMIVWSSGTPPSDLQLVTSTACCTWGNRTASLFFTMQGPIAASGFRRAMSSSWCATRNRRV